MSTPVYWLNGRIVPAVDAVLPIDDHGVLYGDGVFEGIRFHGGTPFRLAPHLYRLEASARALRLELPFSRAELARAVSDVIDAFDAPDGYIRLVATRGPGRLGLDPSDCASPNLFLIAADVSIVSAEQRQRGADLVIASHRRPGPVVLDPRIKSLNYLNNIMARLEARHAGADEAVLLNERGFVAEGTAENLFALRGGALRTPPLTDGALDGITRGAVITLCRERRIAVEEASLTPYDLYTADECFLCGTGAGLIPVRRIDGRPLRFCPGPLYVRVAEAYENLIQSECR